VCGESLRRARIANHQPAAVYPSGLNDDNLLSSLSRFEQIDVKRDAISLTIRSMLHGSCLWMSNLRS
jgi:hypothetical protein